MLPPSHAAVMPEVRHSGAYGALMAPFAGACLSAARVGRRVGVCDDLPHLQGRYPACQEVKAMLLPCAQRSCLLCTVGIWVGATVGRGGRLVPVLFSGGRGERVSRCILRPIRDHHDAGLYSFFKPFYLSRPCNSRPRLGRRALCNGSAGGPPKRAALQDSRTRLPAVLPRKRRRELALMVTVCPRDPADLPWLACLPRGKLLGFVALAVRGGGSIRISAEQEGVIRSTAVSVGFLEAAAVRFRRLALRERESPAGHEVARQGGYFS
jgi:hypothetical protein